jgi:hypothetical protein
VLPDEGALDDFYSVGFEIDVAVAVRDQKVMRDFNAVLARLRDRRLRKIEAFAEPFAHSKIACKLPHICSRCCIE